MRDYAVFTMVDREGDTIFVGVERLANITGEYLLSSRSGYKLEDLDIARVAGMRLVYKNLDFETANIVAKAIRATLTKCMSEKISDKQIAPEFARSIPVADVSEDSAGDNNEEEEEQEPEKSEEEILAEYASAGISPEVVALSRLEDRTEIMIKQAAAYLKARKYMLEEGANSPNALWHDYLGELLTGRLEAVGVENDKIIRKEAWFSRDISAVGKQLFKLARAAEDNGVSIELPPYSEQNIRDIRELRGESLEVVKEEPKAEIAPKHDKNEDDKKLPRYMTEPVEDQQRREQERSAKVRAIRPQDLPFSTRREGMDPKFAKHLELPDHLKVQDFDFGDSAPTTGDPIVDALVKEYRAPTSKKTEVFDDEKEQNKFLILSHTLELLKASLAKRREQYDLHDEHMATAVKLERKMRARKIPETDIVTQSDVGRTRTGEVKSLIQETELEIQELKKRKFDYETSKPISNEERLELTLKQEEEILKTMKESGLSTAGERNKQRAKIRAIKEKIASL